MNSTPKFLVGEPVVRITDGLVGKVVRVDPWHEGGWAYAVDLGREPMQGFADDIWSGTEGAWRSALPHAHVSTQSQDCDGRYLHEHVDRPNSIERTEEFGDLHFKERILGNIVSFHAEDGTLTVNPGALYWNQPTDEGYTSTHVVWCEQDDCDDKATQRDFSAERMGY